MENEDKGKIWITDFNHMYLKYIIPKLKDDIDTKIRIRGLKRQIEKKIKLNKEISQDKRKLTIGLNNGKINYILYAKQYNLLTADSIKNKIDIKESKEVIDNLLNKKDAKIRFKGIFVRRSITRSYLTNLKNPALHLLRLDLSACETIINNPNYKIVNSDKQQNGIESQYERILLNIKLVQGKDSDTEDEYPIEVLITPSRILFL